MSKKVAFFAGHYEDLFDEERSKGLFTNTEEDGQYEEFDSNIVIARQAVKELREVPGLTVYFPQEDGSDYRSLRSRVNFCNEHDVDIAIFVHSNAAGSSANGACAFYYYTSEDGKRMAFLYKDEMSNAEYPLWSDGTYGCNPDDGWSNFYVVRNTRMPALLTENFFFTNPRELREYLQDETELKKVGHIHARVACRALGIDTKYLSTVKSASDVKAPKPTDRKRYRLATGAFANARDLALAKKRLKDKHPWMVYERADDTGFDPTLRLWTGTFVGKNVARHYAGQLTKEFGWQIYVKEE